MSYFVYNPKTKQFSIAKNSKGQNKRPNNQNTRSVLLKIYQRLQNLFNKKTKMKPTKLQKSFMQMIEANTRDLSGLSIDIAHHIAISVIMKVIVDRMNHSIIGRDKKAKKFVEEFISTEDDDAKETIQNFFNTLQDSKVSPKEKIKLANKVVSRLNQASKNYLPGDASTNRSISANKDLHYVKEDGEYIQTLVSQRIGKAFDMFKGGSPYLPKMRVNPEGEVEWQSSSIAGGWIVGESSEASDSTEDDFVHAIDPDEINSFTPIIYRKRIANKNHLNTSEISEDNSLSSEPSQLSASTSLRFRSSDDSSS